MSMTKTDMAYEVLTGMREDAKTADVIANVLKIYEVEISADTVRAARKRLANEAEANEQAIAEDGDQGRTEDEDLAQSLAEDGDGAADEPGVFTPDGEAVVIISDEEPGVTEAPEPEKPAKAPREKTGYASTHPKGTVSDSSQRCGAETKSGPCVRPLNHGFGHMSQSVLDVKTMNAAAKRAARAEAARNAKKAEAGA